MNAAKLATAFALAMIVADVADLRQAAANGLQQPESITPVGSSHASSTPGIRQPDSQQVMVTDRVAARTKLRQPELLPSAPQQAGYYDDKVPAGPPEAPMAPERAGNHAEGHSDGYAEGAAVVDGSAACGCESGGYGGDCCCDSGCNNGGWGNCLGDCCLGEPWVLRDCLTPCCCDGPEYGGWFSFGYYNNAERLSIQRGDERSFNDLPHNLNLDQAWFYVGKEAQADCGCGYGYRLDVMYGAQGHTAQSFGNDGGTWDVTWDHGSYEWAIPQLYGEVAFGDWNVKVGHFFTPAGYEVVPATGNFFYSHSLTHYNSEPFTHTGVLGTYSANDCLTVYTGWSLGWDTGFDQFGAGNIFLGGFGYEAGDDVTFTYITTIGNFGWRSGNQDGWSQHIVALFDICCDWQYVIQHDYVVTNGVVTDDEYENEDKGVTQYLFYTLNDCWRLGGRAEWWKSNNVVAGEDISFYEVSGGINYKPHANVVVRPEIRYDWTPAADTVNDAAGVNYNQTWFGVDAIFTY